MRRLPRRRQGQQRGQGGAPVRPRSQGCSLEPQALRDLRLPAIAFWNFNHFVVVEGMGPKGGLPQRSRRGPRGGHREEFDQSFTGVMLTSSPGRTSSGAASSRPSRARSPRACAARRGLVCACSPGLALVVPGLAAPASPQDLRGPGPRRRAPRLAAVPVAAGSPAAGRGRADLDPAGNLLRLSTKLSLSMSTRFLRHVLRLPVDFFASATPGTSARGRAERPRSPSCSRASSRPAS